jgi:3-oxoisoapionate decarboxylase
MPLASNFQFGISSWSYPWAVGVRKGPRPVNRMSAQDLVENAHELGVEILQIADNLQLENLPWETMIKLKRTAGEFGVKIEIGTRGTKKDHLNKFLEVAQFLGSTLVRVQPCIFGKRASISEVEENIRSVIKEYEKAGVIMVLENQEGFKAHEYRELMENINHPNLRICLDLANAIGAMECPEYVMKELGPWCGNFHFKDVVAIRAETVVGFNIEGRPSGKGQLSLPWALDQLNTFGVQCSTIIELWPPWQGNIGDTIELEKKWVIESIAYAKSLQ